MCEHDATLRDLQTSLERAQETINDLREQLILSKGVGRALALSMRTEGTPDWKRACFRLAYRLASQLDKPETTKELTAFMYLADALDEPEPTKDTEGD
jgi:hypothetical protein